MPKLVVAGPTTGVRDYVARNTEWVSSQQLVARYAPELPIGLDELTMTQEQRAHRDEVLMPHIIKLMRAQKNVIYTFISEALNDAVLSEKRNWPLYDLCLWRSNPDEVVRRARASGHDNINLEQIEHLWLEILRKEDYFGKLIWLRDDEKIDRFIEAHYNQRAVQ